MELFERGDMRKSMNGPIPECETRDIAIQLLQGLIILHDAGFTHRDLKPEVSLHHVPDV